MSDKKWKVEVVNIVATSEIGEDIDLKKIAKLDGVKYNPRVFPGAVLRISQPKAAILVFRSGRIVCTGTKRIEDARIAVEKAVKIISDMGIKVECSGIRIQNVVASADLGSEINLNALAIGFLERIEYEPEQFPGLVYRLDNPRVVILVFSTGKIVIVGCKNIDEVERAVENVYKSFSSLGII